MENHSRNDIIGNPGAPYLNSLAAKGAEFSRSFAITHPSEPNYLALFSGSTHGVTSDACPVQLHGPTLASELRAAHKSFVGYSESLPSVGFTGCSSGSCARKHNPWVDFGALPKSINRPTSALPARFADLPTVSFVVPNLQHDMHDGTIAQGDQWVRRHLGGYIQAARKHHGLVIITWDEDDYSQANRVPTILLGGNINPGVYRHRIDHYSVLRTLESAYHLPAIGQSAHRAPITNIWKRPATN